MATKQKKESLKLDTVEPGSGNVFADLGFENADELQFKAELTRQILRRVNDLSLTQVQAGKRLGLKQPDVSKLMKGKFTGFSTDRLLSLLTSLNIDVEIVLRPRERKQHNAGLVRVLAEAR